MRLTSLFLLRYAWYFLTKLKASLEEGSAALNNQSRPVQTLNMTLLPNLSSNIRQTRQTQFLGILRTQPCQDGPRQHFRCAGQRVAKLTERQLECQR